jgi:hypothetical protein
MENRLLSLSAKQIATTLTLVLSGGCCLMPGETATSVVPISNVLDQVKREIGEYQIYDITEGKSGKKRPACGAEQDRIVSMTPLSATLTLKTALDSTQTGTGKLGVLKIGTATPSGNAGSSSDISSAQTIKLEMKPLPSRHPTGNDGSKKGSLGLTQALKSVRDGLMNTNTKEPCLLPNKLTVTMIFGVKQSENSEFGIDLVVLSLDTKFSKSREDTQTLELVMDLKGSTAAFQ